MLTYKVKEKLHEKRENNDSRRTVKENCALEQSTFVRDEREKIKKQDNTTITTLKQTDTYLKWHSF